MTELILALDTAGRKDGARRFSTRSASVQWVKVGSILFVREGPAFVRSLVDRGLDVFLDLKWHDIPNTVSGAVAQRARSRGSHGHGAHPRRRRDDGRGRERGRRRTCDVVGVTVLTSHTPASFGEATGRAGLDLVAGRHPAVP